MKKAGSVYIENTKWNFGEYFEDVIGVTVKEEKKAEPIKLWVDGEQYNYIKTKPLHGSQRVIERREDNSRVIQIEVQENYELYQKLLSFGEKVVVLEPERIRKKLQERIWIMGGRYDRFR